MDWKHPTYYKALEKQRKEFEASERAQADKRASQEEVGEGGPKGHKHDRHPQPPSKCNR